MSYPIQFTSSTPRIGIPLLFAGQTQKEFYVNEAYALIDGLMHCAVEGISQNPPASSVDGEAWLVDSTPGNSWVDHGGKLALFQGGNWLFVAPSEGMTVYDKSTGQFARYDGAWRKGAAIALPQGGTTADQEARAAIAELVDALIEAGIVPAT